MKGFWLLIGFVLLAVLSKAQDPSGLAAQPGYDWYKYKYLSATEGFYNAQRDTTWKPGTAGAQVFAHNTIWFWDGSSWRNDADGIKPEWFGAKGDGVTNDRAAIQAAVDYLHALGRGKLIMKAKTYLADSLIWYGNINMVGAGGYSYSETTDGDEGGTVLKLVAGSDYLIKWTGAKTFGFYNVTFDGNGGEVSKTGTCLVSDISSRSMTIENCKIYHFNIGFAGNSAGDCRLINSTFRNCTTGASSFKDSDVQFCTFSSNKGSGIYLNNGQVNIIGCFIEWNREGTDSSANGIMLDGNCSRILISNCKFDRNTGNDIRIAANPVNTPNLITITGCQFKRAGWGSDLADIDRASIWMKKANNTHITGNTFWTGGYGAGGTAGLISPSYAIHMDSCTEVKIMANSYPDAKQKLDLSVFYGSPAFQWVASGSAYYLQRSVIGADSTYNTWVGQPDIVGYDSAKLASGTLGSLSTGQWAWGDNNGLGYSTIYVRLTGDKDPNSIGIDTLFAYYDHNLIYSVRPIHYSSDDARDHIPTTSVAAGDSISFYLYTDAYTSTSNANQYTIILNARQVTTGIYSASTINFQVQRGFTGTPACTLTIGSIDNDISGLSVGTANSDLNISMSPDIIGTRIKVTITNTTSNNININGVLKW